MEIPYLGLWQGDDGFVFSMSDHDGIFLSRAQRSSFSKISSLYCFDIVFLLKMAELMKHTKLAFFHACKLLVCFCLSCKDSVTWAWYASKLSTSLLSEKLVCFSTNNLFVHSPAMLCVSNHYRLAEVIKSSSIKNKLYAFSQPFFVWMFGYFHSKH